MSKVIVITGASSGIGAAAAELLAGQGHSVVLAARRRPELEAVASRCHGRAHVVVTDVSKREDVKRLVEQAIGRFGHIDVWINNAGYGITRPPSQLTDHDVQEMMQVNVMSALYGMQEVLPHFKERGAGQVVNVSSMLGRMPMALFRSAYSGAKHFLNAITAMMRAEVQQTHPGIQFTIISPGVVATDFGLNAKYGGPDSRSLPAAQDVNEVATVVAKVIDTRQPDVYTRAGSHAQITQYFASIGSDPS